MPILGRFFLSFEFRSHIDHFPAFVRAAFRTDAMREDRRLAFRAFLRIDQGDVVLFARPISAMAGMSLLGIGHIGTKLLTFPL